jgi:hypothetical protein
MLTSVFTAAMRVLGIFVLFALIVAAAYGIYVATELLKIGALASIPGFIFAGFAVVALVGVGVISMLEPVATSADIAKLTEEQRATRRAICDALLRQTEVLERVAMLVAPAPTRTSGLPGAATEPAHETPPSSTTPGLAP